MTDRFLTVEVLCVHGKPGPHSSGRTELGCEGGKVIVLLEGQAIRIKTGYVIDVTEIIDVVLSGDNIRRSQPA